MPTLADFTELEKSRIADQLKIAPHVSLEALNLERELYLTKWFDYRFISPVEATQRFADAYVTIYRDIWCQQFDRNAAASKKALASGGLYHNHREFSLMWGARQAADALGAPYELHIRHAMDIKLRLGWKKPPRPNQLCGIKKADKMVPALQKRWDERKEVMQFTNLPVYRSENFVGFHAQLDHQAYVLDRVATHGHRPWAAGSASIAKRLVAIDRIADRWGEEFAARAVDEGRSETPVPLEKIDVASVLPSCFGRIGDGDPVCGACPAAGRCGVISNITKQLIERKYGAVDPVKARAAGLNADRQRRFRQKKAAARAAAKAASATASAPVVALSA